MKACIIILCLTISSFFSSCQKEYVCVCTHTQTGNISYGDKFKTGPLRKDAFEKTCENNGDLSLGTLKDCHLE